MYTALCAPNDVIPVRPENENPCNKNNNAKKHNKNSRLQTATILQVPNGVSIPLLEWSGVLNMPRLVLVDFYTAK